MTNPWTPEKRQRLAEMVAAGTTYREIADALGVSRNAISGQVYRQNMRVLQPSAPDRNARIVAMFLEGQTTRQIGSVLHMSKDAVSNVLKRRGVKRDPDKRHKPGFAAGTRAAKPAPKAPPKPKPATPSPEGGLRIMDEGFGGCRAPLWGDGADTRFCCQPIDRRMFCAEHAARFLEARRV